MIKEYAARYVIIRYVTVFLIMNVFAVSWSQNTVQDYVNKYSQTAISEMKRTGIPASIILAQGILESSFGNSQLALQANNHFNLPCEKNWDGEFFYQWSPKQNQKPSCFRVYEAPEASFLAYTNRLMSNDALGNLLMYRNNNYKKWAEVIVQEGLQTKSYPSDQIMLVIENYELAAFDGVINRKETKPSSSQRRVLDVNGARAILAQSNDTPLKIASEFKIPLRKILDFNDLEEGEEFQADQFIFLESKKNRSKQGEEYHIVQANETLYDIAQMYGIKLKSLCKLNHLQFDDRVASGERVNLIYAAAVAPRLMGEPVAPVEKPANNTSVKPVVVAPVQRPKNRISTNPTTPDEPPVNNSNDDNGNKIKIRPITDNVDLNSSLNTQNGGQGVAINNDNNNYNNSDYNAQNNSQNNASSGLNNIPGKVDTVGVPPPSKPDYLQNNNSNNNSSGAPVPTIDGVRADQISQNDNNNTPSSGDVIELPPPGQNRPTSSSVADNADDNANSANSANISSNANTNDVNPADPFNNQVIDDNEDAAPTPPVKRDGYHIVEKGETLYRIALKYRVTVEGLKYWNELSSNEIEIGQELKVRP